MKKILVTILCTMMIACVGTLNIYAGTSNVSDNQLITIDIDGEKQFRIIGNVGNYTKVMSMYDIDESTYSDNLVTHQFSDDTTGIKYEGSNVDTILGNWYQSLKTKNIALYRAIMPQYIYQSNAHYSLNNPTDIGYLTTWLGTNNNQTLLAYQYINFSNSGQSLDFFNTPVNGSIMRAVYAPSIKDIFDYYGIDEALGADYTNKIFFNQTGAVNKNVWLRDADNANGRSNCAWAIVGSVGGIGTNEANLYTSGVRAEFVVDLSKVVYKDYQGITHIPVPEGKTLFYTGSEQCGLYGLNDCVSANNYMKTNIGTYSANVSLNNNCVWSDGSTNNKQVNFSIGYPYIGIDVNGNKTIETNEKFRVLNSNGNKKTVLSMFDIGTAIQYGSSQSYSGSNVDTVLNNWYEGLASNVKTAIQEKDIYQYEARWTNDFPNPFSGYYTTWMNPSVSTSTQEFDASNIYQWLVFSDDSQAIEDIDKYDETSLSRKVYAPSIKDIFDVYGVNMAIGASDVNALFFSNPSNTNSTVWLRDADKEREGSSWVVVGSAGGIGTNETSLSNSVRAMFTIDLSDIYWTNYNENEFNTGMNGKVITAAKNSNSDIKGVELKTISENSAKKILANTSLSGAIEEGKEVKLYVDVTPCSDSSVFASKNLNPETSILLDVDLYAYIVGEESSQTKITDTNGEMIKVTIELSPTQAQKILGENKNYFILRKHEGEDIEKISADLTKDEDTGNYLFTFETDKFSQYAIYSETKVKSGKYRIVNTCVK